MTARSPAHARPWRSLAEKAEDPEFLARAAAEFPALADLLNEPRGRRQVLRLMAASFALGGLAACGRSGPDELLVPDVIAPPGAVPGMPDAYSSASVLGGFASGTYVTHRDGRPIKVEGNPNHPASLGATGIFAQAEILGFYDPARRAALTFRGQPAGWSNFQTALAARRGVWGSRNGAGLRILTETVTSPTLGRQLAGLQLQYPEMRWHQWEPVSRDASRAGAMLAYGRYVETVPDLAAAGIILAIDSDALSSAPGHLRFARDFAGGRNPSRTPAMSRLYAIESTPTLTGAAADHRFVLPPDGIATALTALTAMILRNEKVPGDAPAWLAPLAADLQAAHGRALLLIGPDQPAEAHALVHVLNEALEGRSRTFRLIASPEAAPVDQAASLGDLATDMAAGRIDTLLILGGNPVFSAPADLGFATALRRVACSVHLAQELDETSQAVQWHLPATHCFEAWSDARAFDGTATIIQPQALPLYGGRSAHELLAMLVGEATPDGMAIVRRAWQSELTADASWEQALATGIVPGTNYPGLELSVCPEAAAKRIPVPAGGALTVLFRPDPHIWDGRFAANAWLQEMPRPLTKLSWDNPLLIAPATAQALGLANGDLATLAVDGRQIKAPVWILPGQATGCVTALFGPGRRSADSPGNEAGFDYFPLVVSSNPSQARATLAKATGTYPLATTEHHQMLTDIGSNIVRQADLSAFQASSLSWNATEVPEPSLYASPPQSQSVGWGMSIDLNACIGCNACVIACQAENNIPVVGKEQVLREREMHWLRIDRYYSGSIEEPETAWQPMLCMHCEHAPCEVVCPVGATLHDAEGLNVMVYNRCIGTRFCSNNCPYKVRRFNYLAYSAAESRTAESRNPEVTVRARGVMEKCTFCIQRIAAARLAADEGDRPIADGEVVTACQAACPTQALTFGNIKDPASAVAARKLSPLAYILLPEENTRPRVSYEGRIRNPNSEIPAGQKADPA